MQKQIITTLLLLLSPPILAEDYWQCTAHDKTLQSWQATHQYSVVAKLQAMQACQHQSVAPKTCVVIPEQDCEGFEQDASTKAMWQCTAIDQSGEDWHNHATYNQDNAVLQAMAMCEKFSTIPDTCYVNPLFCNNINQR